MIINGKANICSAWFFDTRVRISTCGYTVYVVYLVAALIWQFGESRKYCQIKMYTI